MLLIRPIRMEDAPAFLALCEAAGPGMTSLPTDTARVEQKIATSLESFAKHVSEPGEEYYLFVLEDTDSGRIAGTCALLAAVGLSRPFYSYKIVQFAHTSLELGHFEEVDALMMVNEYRGAAEVASLFLLPEFRRDHAGKFLSRSRFLFLAQFGERFADLVMAEMRGVHDEQGRSPFWEGLGRHFFDMEFINADRLSSLGKYQFIADLMPKFPVYIRLLPQDAQAVVGEPHPHTRPAYELLLREGFRFEGCVDVFDAGPTLHCPRADIRGVRKSRVAELAWVVDRVPPGPRQMVANTWLDRYRALAAPLMQTDDGRIIIGAEAAEALGVEPGDSVRFTEL
ncbi:arginine N-succinyltransferase [Plasticicumulans acidivorans]|uniref:Arginine N-succinyltransferase n=1 Tax=Plasticicumulans acidivorans TaxID=886464 RepID=A0A317MZ19_9GAMM|nr:arginine N-succinyltransferase [Plasticicumulans acidivorans]PWV61042.1 arginine N-succinyltransferase [Plasticicumulans acidivorans]